MLLFWCILFVWGISGGGAQAVQLPGNVSIPAVIAFGDSIVDQGLNNRRNTVAKCNFPPYGKDFMGGVSTGRFSNGRTPPDMIASKLGIKELVPAYLDPNLRNEDLPTGVSFASGGMGYDPQTNKLLAALPFPDQLKLFKEYIEKLKVLVGEERTNYTLANGVFLVIAGSNDFANTYFTVGLRRVKYDVPAYADLLLAYASEYVQAIYQLGARRIAVFGMPPIGCLPSQRSLAGGVHSNCVQSYNEAAQTYNTRLTSKLLSLGQTLPHSKIIYADIYNPVLDVIQSPQNYGINVVNKGCCGTGNIEASILCNKLSKTCPDRSAYLFWDSFHPTQKGYEIIVNRFLKNEFDQLL